MQKGENLQAALTYLEKYDFSVIPIKPANKKPFFEWKPFQQQKPTINEVREWWTQHPDAMIGIVTGSISGIDVVDTDNQEADEELQGYLSDSFVCPTQRTPGGGKHYLFIHAEGIRNSNDRSPFKFHVRGEGGYFIAAPSKNGTGGHYEWLDGLSIEEVALPPMPNTLYNSLINAFREGERNFKTSEEEHTKAHESTPKHKMFEDGVRDESLFHTANCLVKGGMPKDEISQVIEAVMESWGEGHEEKWREEKIKSALKRAERRDRNISQEVREWVEGTQGHFESTQIHREAHLSTKEEMHAVNATLRRLVEEGVIERYGDKRGCYRRVNRDYIRIDLQDASSMPLDIRWPFGIEKYYRPFPKNIVTVAGTPDSGKSAFLFNLAKDNMDKFNIHYFSSEMGADELWDRLANFGLSKNEWTKKCELIERSTNFQDVIFPDDINIIDYLDMTGGEGKEFYKVGDFLEQIYEKLRRGIAIIAIQKDFGRDLGRGGLGTIERPRLSLSMEGSKVKIIKCKNWVNKKLNPNHLELSFKLVDGCKFIIEKDWHR